MTRRTPTRHVVALVALAALAIPSALRAAEYPLSDGRITVKYGPPTRQSATLRGRWPGTLPATPAFGGATLRIAGAYGEGGTESIVLDAAKWTELRNGAGWRYFDRDARAGGVRSVSLRAGRNGRPGTLTVSAANEFDFGHRAPSSRVRIALEIGLDRWCADAPTLDDNGVRIVAKAADATPSCPAEMVVSAGWLKGRLGRPDVQVIDTRSTFADGHILGALPLRPESLATTISGIGAQMMPPELAEPVLSGIGLRRDATVVVYGTAPEYDPARTAWALAYLGHPDVRYLDGGWEGWLAAGGTTAPGGPVAAAPTAYVADPYRPEVRVTSDYVLAQLGPPPYASPAIQLADARSSAEYATARIPSAAFAPWQDNLAAGFLKPRADREAFYDGLGFDPTETTVTYCLVGWRASVAWLTLRWLGYGDVRVYDGSWLEWGAGGFPVEP
ncbi:MAG: sulfurtransferase [Deltaproteobacteria bacterium]|nr:sulfurtransferase [Deltaproteobacteria bacterium]